MSYLGLLFGQVRPGSSRLQEASSPPQRFSSGLGGQEKAFSFRSGGGGEASRADTPRRPHSGGISLVTLAERLMRPQIHTHFRFENSTESYSGCQGQRGRAWALCSGLRRTPVLTWSSLSCTSENPVASAPHTAFQRRSLKNPNLPLRGNLRGSFY